MGRRRRKIVRVPRRSLPKAFSCPRCGKETVRVEIFRDENRAVASCGGCDAKEEFSTKPAQSEVDIYCMFTDRIYGSSKEAAD